MFLSSGFPASLMIAGIALVSSGCAEKKDAPAPAEKKDAPAPAPTKEAAIKVLNDFLTALEAKKHEDAASFIDPVTKKRYETRIPTLIEGRTITRKGFDEFVAHGTYGQMKDVRPGDDLNEIAKLLGDSPDNVWMIRYQGSAVEAIFHWTGKEFKILSIDGIGYVGPDGGRGKKKSEEDPKK